ncbi:MAG: ArsR/SmtB family transcription factor [Candidatus Binatus sp.]
MPIDATIWALADSTRRELLRRLADKPCRAGELARGFAISRPAICKHTRMLGRAGLIRVRKVGRERIYELEPRGRVAVEELIRKLEEVGGFWDTTLNAFRRYVEENR